MLPYPWVLWNSTMGGKGQISKESSSFAQILNQDKKKLNFQIMTRKNSIFKLGLKFSNFLSNQEIRWNSGFSRDSLLFLSQNAPYNAPILSSIPSSLLVGSRIQRNKGESSLRFLTFPSLMPRTRDETYYLLIISHSSQRTMRMCLQVLGYMEETEEKNQSFSME